MNHLLATGSLTIMRTLAAYSFGRWSVTWPDSVPEDVRPDPGEGFEFGYVADFGRNPGRFGRRFAREDAMITAAEYDEQRQQVANSGSSNVEFALDTAAKRTAGSPFIENTITRAGLNGNTPWVDFDVDDIVPVQIFGKTLSLPVTQIVAKTEQGAVIDWDVFVGGSLLADTVERERANLELRQEIAKERRERQQITKTIASDTRRAGSIAAEAIGKAGSALAAAEKVESFDSRISEASDAVQDALNAVDEMRARLDEGVDTSRFDELMAEHSDKLAALADDLLALEATAATRDERLTDLDAALADAAKDLAAADKALQNNAAALSGLQSSLATANANIAKKLDSATYTSKMTALDSSLAALNADLSQKVSESVFNDTMSTYVEELVLVGSAALEKGLLQPGNLVWNPAGKLDMNGVQPASPLKATVSASGGKTKGRFIMSWSGTPSNQYMNFSTQAEQRFDIHQGQEFLVSAWVKPSIDLDAGALRLYLYSGSNYITSPAMPAGVWTEIRGMVRISSTTTVQRSYVRIWHSGTAIPHSATWDISDVFCTEMAGDLLVVDGAISAKKVAANAIEANHISAGAVVAGKIAANAVTATEIKSGTITATEIATGAITAAKIASNTITANEIAANAVTASELAANSVLATNIQAGAVTTAKIAANAVTANEIAANAVTAVKIASNTITAAKIAAGAITASELASGSVTAVKIASNAVTAAQIAANTITAAEIAAGTITGTEIAANTIMANQLQITPGNLFPDPHFKDPSWLGTDNVTPNTNNGGELRITADGKQRGRYYQPSGLTDKSMTLEAGAAYRLTANVYMANGINPKNLSVYMRYLHTDGSVKVVLLGNLVGTTGTTVSALNLTTPTAMKDGTCTLGFYLQATNAAGQGSVSVWDVQLTRAADASLIVDGAIQAQHIDTGSITTSHINSAGISAGVIKTGTMSADRITGGTIDASKVRVTNLNAADITSGTMSADRIKAGSITADKVNAGEIYLTEAGDKDLEGLWNEMQLAVELQNSISMMLLDRYEQLSAHKMGVAQYEYKGSVINPDHAHLFSIDSSTVTALGAWEGIVMHRDTYVSDTEVEMKATRITATNRRFSHRGQPFMYEVFPIQAEKRTLKPSATTWDIPTASTWTTIPGMSFTLSDQATRFVIHGCRIEWTNVHRGSTYGVRVLVGGVEVSKWTSADFGPLTSLGNPNWHVSLPVSEGKVGANRAVVVQAYCSNSTASKRRIKNSSTATVTYYT